MLHQMNFQPSSLLAHAAARSDRSCSATNANPMDASPLDTANLSNASSDSAVKSTPPTT